MTINLVSAFKASDSDGDAVAFAPGAIQVVVENDVPAALTNVFQVRVDEDELSVAAADGDLSTGNTDLDGDVDEVTFTQDDLRNAFLVLPGADDPITFFLNQPTATGLVLDLDGNEVYSQGAIG